MTFLPNFNTSLDSILKEVARKLLQDLFSIFQLSHLQSYLALFLVY